MSVTKRSIRRIEDFVREEKLAVIEQLEPRLAPCSVHVDHGHHGSNSPIPPGDDQSDAGFLE